MHDLISVKMTDGFAELSNRLDEGVGRLISKIEELKSLNTKQSAEIKRLTDELEESRKEAEASRRELECCKVGMLIKEKTSIDGSTDYDQVKKQISQLVRGIDECIALLKQ